MRSTIASVSVSALQHNISTIRKKTNNVSLMAMVKANAYGHGMIDVAHIIEPLVDCFGVAVMHEGITLRLAKITKPIIVMMPPDIYDAEKFCEGDLEMMACSLDLMESFNAEARRQDKKLKAHLYIDTGMRRDGIEPSDACAFMKAMKEFECINVVGICTHFATSDDEDPTFTNEQLQKFQTTIETLKENGYSFLNIHAANSGGIFFHPNSHSTMVRAGLALYGILPRNVPSTHHDVVLQPVLSLRSRINAIRRITAGESVSYGRRYIARKDTTIVTIPIGYGDGYSRSLSNKGFILLHGQRFPIVGTICMDECMVDVGDEKVTLGDEVVFIGKQGDEEISAWEIATILQTIPYEITTGITARVPRVIVE